MSLKSLENSIASSMRGETRGKVPEPTPESTSTAIMLREQQELPLASARDIGIFALFDLPPEMVEAIISEMVNTVGFYRASRLRVVNSESFVAKKKVALTGQNSSITRSPTFSFLKRMPISYPMNYTGLHIEPLDSRSQRSWK